MLVAVLGIVGWARPARLIRGIVLSARERTYVTAARGFGAQSPYLLWRHVLPQTYGVVLTQAGLLVPQYLLAEVTLSFLGLGVGEPTPSWGAMLGNLQQYSRADVLLVDVHAGRRAGRRRGLRTTRSRRLVHERMRLAAS